ncbi:hypothetical protein HF086_004611 [Spodoptera exigua]|uniref:Uncharacterized protein n=1 Tax=Spodoptera exigua TaxID=7107 RepID=A0A922SL78_SPOEX|nr:hypothetical protein HF086_004611 [Spodoptera exigua]
MDSELRLQLNSVLEKYEAEEEVDFNNDPMKQLEAIIKQEPTDSDDDCYYVLVIDDPKDKNKEPEVDISNIKLENIEDVPMEETTDSYNTQQSQSSQSQFEDSIESFLMSNTKVSANVPATILENEEVSHENEDLEEAMNIDESQNIMVQQQNLGEGDDESQDNEIIETISTDVIKDLPNSKNFIKILTTADSDGTILLKGNDRIQYLTDSQLVTNEDEDGDALSQEVIFCEGDDSSQFQILKYDGSELVIEYAGDSQIATVLQQEDGTFCVTVGSSLRTWLNMRSISSSTTQQASIYVICVVKALSQQRSLQDTCYSTAVLGS